jgi:glutamate---cysteine ligase / carboxylate-amine ligase
MSRSPDDFTIGVEEEFQLVDPATRELRSGVDDVLPEAQQRTSPDEVSHELQQSQIEIGTPVCRRLAEVRAELVRLRAEVRESAAHRGLTIVAAGSHPLSRIDRQRITDVEDYRRIADHYAHLADEQVVFGCHVHVGVADQELAIAAMNHIRPWLAPLVALSSSSPFWSGADTGYASYRSEVFGRWPTAGTVEPFASRAEYEEVVDQLLATGSIDAPARIYWDVRPSARYDTLELRVADVCTSVDDAVLVAGLAGALVRQGAALAEAGEPAPDVRPELLRAARWRAARFGTSADLVDLVAMRAVPAAGVVEQLLAYVEPALEEWGERDEVDALARQVLARGTSAARQRARFAERGSLDDVVDWLIEETAA